MKILVLHGPNLNLLGEREPEVYGTTTLAQLNARLRAHARRKKIALKIFQSNSEGRLIDLIHAHRKWADGLVFNPCAYTHYSYALRDAVAGAPGHRVVFHPPIIPGESAFVNAAVRPLAAPARGRKSPGPLRDLKAQAPAE